MIRAEKVVFRLGLLISISNIALMYVVKMVVDSIIKYSKYYLQIRQEKREKALSVTIPPAE